MVDVSGITAVGCSAPHHGFTPPNYWGRSYYSSVIILVLLVFHALSLYRSLGRDVEVLSHMNPPPPPTN